MLDRGRRVCCSFMQPVARIGTVLWRRAFVVSALLLSSVVAAEEPLCISEIRFEGNEVTKPSVLLRELDVAVGDVVQPERIERSRQSIMDLGLFRSVDTRLSEDGTLTFVVKEKLYFLVVPKLSRRDDDRIGWGGELRLDNLGGLNQRLRMELERTDAAHADAGEDREYSIEYRNPRFGSGAWGIDTQARLIRGPLQARTGQTDAALYEREEINAQFLVFRWLNSDAPSRGFRLGAGLTARFRRFEPVEGDPGLFDNGRLWGLVTEFSYTNVHDLLYSRKGRDYGWQGEFGLPALGSDHGYSRHFFYYRRYLPLWREHYNFNYQVRLGLTDRRMFGAEVYDIGDNRSLRGYEDISGNAFVLANIEYLQPIFGSRSLRGLAFLDLGNAYPKIRQLDFSGLKTSAGLGLRIRLKRFVNLSLRLDAAYAIERDEMKFIAGTRATF